MIPQYVEHYLAEQQASSMQDALAWVCPDDSGELQFSLFSHETLFIPTPSTNPPAQAPSACQK